MSLASQVSAAFTQLATVLRGRVNVASGMAAPSKGFIVGGWFNNSFNGTATTTIPGAANQLDLAPFSTNVAVTIDTIGSRVTTLFAGGKFKIVIYDSDALGWPNNLLYNSGDLVTDAAGFISVASTFQFLANKRYWVGMHRSGTATMSAIPIAAAASLGLSSNTGNPCTAVRRSVTYANGPPATFAMTLADMVAGAAITPPDIRIKPSAITA